MGRHAPGTVRLAAIGDSYTYDAEVDEDRSFAAFLGQRLSSSEVLNMGVRAYGIDQAALKYIKYGRQYHPDVVVFGIFGPDYHRTLLSFYRFAKPLFKLDPQGVFTLANTPVPSPEQEYENLRRADGPLTYTTTQLIRMWRRLAQRYTFIEIVDLMDELPAKAGGKPFYETMLKYHDGKPSGHFTLLGNEAVAAIISEHLAQRCWNKMTAGLDRLRPITSRAAITLRERCETATSLRLV